MSFKSLMHSEGTHLKIGDAVKLISIHFCRFLFLKINEENTPQEKQIVI